MESLNNNTIILNNYKVILSLGKNQKTGSLYIKKGDILRILYFNKGKFAYAHSNYKGEKLLDIISSSGILSDDFINDVIANIKPGESLGKIFVQKGYLTPMQLTTILEKQQKKIFYSAIFMKEGEVRFFEEELPENIIPLNLSIIGLIRDGLYKTNDRLVILSLAGNLNNKLFVKKSEHEYIKEEEKNILEIVGDGLVSEIINRSPYDEFKTLKIISFLKLINILSNETANSDDLINEGEEEQKKEGKTEDNIFNDDELNDSPTFDISFSPKEENSFTEQIDSLGKHKKNFDISLDKNEGETAPPQKTIASAKEEEREKEEPEENVERKPKNNYQEDITKHSIKKSDIEEELLKIEKKEKNSKIKKILSVFFVLLILAAIGIYFLYFQKPEKDNSSHKFKKPIVEEIKEKKVIPVKKIIEKPIRKSENSNKKDKKNSEELGKTKNRIQEKTIKTPNKKTSKISKKIEQKRIESTIIFPNYLKDIRRGSFRLSAIKYKRDIEKYANYYSILIEIDCMTDSLKTAYQNANFNSKLFIIPRTVKNRFCYAVFWGIYKKRGEAEKEINTLPAFFRKQTPSPNIVILKKYF
jgi:hypothetical protein